MNAETIKILRSLRDKLGKWREDAHRRTEQAPGRMKLGYAGEAGAYGNAQCAVIDLLHGHLKNPVTD